MFIELKECEEEYMKSENEDFWFCRSFEDINLEEIGDQCFWDININNDKIPDIFKLQKIDGHKIECLVATDLIEPSGANTPGELKQIEIIFSQKS